MEICSPEAGYINNILDPLAVITLNIKWVTDIQSFLQELRKNTEEFFAIIGIPID
jgi:hypothetical protein